MSSKMTKEAGIILLTIFASLAMYVANTATNFCLSVGFAEPDMPACLLEKNVND
jgi:hypothetical protein